MQPSAENQIERIKHEVASPQKQFTREEIEKHLDLILCRGLHPASISCARLARVSEVKGYRAMFIIKTIYARRD
jgi:hypothetical protein